MGELDLMECCDAYTVCAIERNVTLQSDRREKVNIYFTFNRFVQIVVALRKSLGISGEKIAPESPLPDPS